MGLELGDQSRSESTMESPVNKENGTIAKEVKNKHLTCISNYGNCTFEVDTPLVDNSTEGCGGEDGNIDIVDTTYSACKELVVENGQESTECSSSFGNVSGTENGAALSDAEVVSDFHENATSALSVDGYAEVFTMRKKRLTNQWRTFMQPLMWRCKWVELQAKKLKFQAHTYDSVLAENNWKELFQVENSLMDFSTKSFPYSSCSKRRKVLKRRKRKTIEETTDMKAYMLQHNLFSYYESRKSNADGVSLDDEQGNLVTTEKINFNEEIGLDNGLMWLESREHDESLEQMLRTIGTLEGQVRQLKTRLDKVMSEIVGMFFYTDKTNLRVPCNTLMHSARDPASPPNSGGRMAAGLSHIASQLISQYRVGDVVLPESAVLNHEEVTHLPDIIESTEWHHLSGSCHADADILIYNERMKEERNNFDQVKIQSMEISQAITERQANTVPSAVVQQDLPAEDQPAPKIRSIFKFTAPKRKMRKGRWKSALGRKRRS